ncbi:hypothetical protein [Modestobacter marinus]|uniref:hypothetical protein n=1 Tax=Modestobacter marinus TaxID=477641 RepID=UPI001C966E59|nr:hypothetical protein [Modestobacter marinus]
MGWIPQQHPFVHPNGDHSPITERPDQPTVVLPKRHGFAARALRIPDQQPTVLTAGDYPPITEKFQLVHGVNVLP